MNFTKYFMRTQPANDEKTFSEETKLFEDAVKAILDGSEPWQIDDLQSTIKAGAFTVAEQKHLCAFVDQRIYEKKKEIMRVALIKVLTGNGLEKGLAIKVATLGKQEEAISNKRGQISQAMLNEEYVKQKLRYMEEYQQCPSEYKKIFDAGNAVQQRIENPFSLK